MNMIDLTGRHVFIAGGSRGIGAAAARMAAQAGADVSISYVSNEAAAESVVSDVRAAGQRGSPGYSNYATSKAAQIMFMRSMAGELAPDQIRVNCIAPAWTETDMAAPSLDVLGREEVAKGFALGRIGLPEDIAGATV